MKNEVAKNVVKITIFGGFCCIMKIDLKISEVKICWMFLLRQGCDGKF